MNINLTKRENILTFKDLGVGAVFYLPDDDEGDSKDDLFMAFESVEDHDCYGYITEYNAINLATGALTYFDSSVSVRLCRATIDAEG